MARADRSAEGHGSDRSRFDRFAPYLAVTFALLAFGAVIVARALYQAPCLSDCGNRSWQLDVQQTIAFVGLIPAIGVIVALLRRDQLWLKLLLPLLLIVYAAWIVVIIDNSG